MRKVVALGLMLVLYLAGVLRAQSPDATVTGLITDASKLVILDAKVTLINMSTGVRYEGWTNKTGSYYVTHLLPGTYRMEVEKPGFKTVIKPEIALHVQDVLEVNFEMVLGSVLQSVTVEGEAPTVQLATSSISAVVNSTTVRELPLNGRDWTQLATLQPGVTAVTTQAPTGTNAPRGNRGFGNQLTISGTRPQLNNYRLDGVSIVDYANGAPGSVLGVALGVDAIAEFSVLTANYSAEYGRTSGGVINAITKSGANTFHGDAYEFIRNSALDARNFFDGASIPPFRRNQFGGSVGGPIQKDKTFFFADYEGLRQFLGETQVDNVLSQDARNGIIHNTDGTTCTIGVVSPGCALKNSAGTVGVDPLVKPYLAFWPLPNAGLLGTGNTGHFDVATNDVSSENFVTARIDRKFSEKDSVFGTWFYDSGLDDTPDALDNIFIHNSTHRVMFSVEETHVFSPSLVNSLRGGFNRVTSDVTQALQAINPLATDKSLGFFPGLPAGGIAVPGLTSFTGGVGGLEGSGNAWNSFQAYDDAFLTKGAHSLKFGFAFERVQHYRLNESGNGGFKFGTLTDFLTNVPLNANGTFTQGSLDRRLQQNIFGGYLQDDWRLRPNWTLNLGLRYEAASVPTEDHNKLSNLPTFTSPTPRLGSPLFNNPTLRNFEPRVGFSWDPFRDGKTAVRGAFGMFDVLPLTYEFFLAEGTLAPFVQAFSIVNPGQGSFPANAFVGDTGVNIPPSSKRSASIEFNPHRNYVMIWNLNVQRQLTSSTTVLVGYVGNHGVHMLNRADEVNLVLPTATAQGYLWPSPIGSGTVINPAVGFTVGEYWSGDAFYDALEVGVTKRMSHGFQVQGSYTWGKNIDTGSSSGVGDAFTNSISSLFWFCKSCRRGLSDFNIAQTLVVNYLWEVPTPNDWTGIGSHVLGGWELGGIVTAETGVPITPLIGGDPLGLNDHDPFAYPNRLTGPGCGSDVNPGNPNNYIKLNCFALPMASPSIAASCTPFSAVPGSCSNLLGNAGRNTVVGPGLVNFDFALFKNNYIRRISESFNVQFRAELFNIFNRANFGTPVHNSTLFDQNGNPVGGAGAIDHTSTTAREIQFALKLIW
jgi:hypothetical protein